MTNTRRLLVASASGAAVVLAAMSFAWACGPQPYISLDPASGTAGTVVSVAGRNFQDGTLEIRWSSANGHLLATTTGPEFSTQVTIPDAAPGSYVIMGVQYEENGDFRGTPGRATFEVQSTQASPPPDDGGSSKPPEERDRQKPTSPSEPRDSTNQSPSRSTGPAPAAPVADPEDQLTPAAALAVEPDAGSTRDGTRKAERRKDRAGDPADVPATVSDSSVTGDLWSGFDPVDGSAPRLATTSETQQLGWQTAFGVAAFGVALVLMLAGFLVATVRRRRVGAEAEDA